MKILDRDDPEFTLASHWQIFINYGRSIGLNIAVSPDRIAQILPKIARSIGSENAARLALDRSPTHSLN
jgi:hypothetical protein